MENNNLNMYPISGLSERNKNILRTLKAEIPEIIFKNYSISPQIRRSYKQRVYLLGTIEITAQKKKFSVDVLTLIISPVLSVAVWKTYQLKLNIVVSC